MKTELSDRNRSRNTVGGGADDGIVLVLCVVMIAVLCFIAGTAMTTLRPELDGAGYFKNERRAFYNAEAGIQYAIDSISRALHDGSLDLTNAVETVSYTAPTGYNFEPITSLHRLADSSSYMFSVTGRAMNARAIIEVTVERPQVLAAGAFGNADLQLQPNIELYSYDSRVTSNPTPANSTGRANAGSNGNITVRPGVVLDGVFLLGEDEFGLPPDPIDGYENEYVDRIDPDPLGTSTGVLASAIAYYSDPANNDNLSAGINDNDINVGSGESLTLPGGQYYLENIYLGSGSILNLEGTVEDPVIFFLNGSMDAKPNSEISTTTGTPTEFFVFSNSTEDIKLYPNYDYNGMIYAPNAYLDLHPNNVSKGVFFAKEVLILPGDESFIDTALLNDFRAPYVEIVQWRHVTD